MLAIVTGASRGLGKAIAIAYAREGATVVVCSRPQSPSGQPGTAGETASEIQDQGGQALGIHCDVTDEGQVKGLVDRVMETYGRIDVLVNNAGLVILGEPFVEIDTQRWDQLMAVNIRGPYLMCRYVLPNMMRQRSGSVVSIGSGMGVDAKAQGGTAYGVSKAALHMFSYALAEEMRPYNIAVNVLSPGGLKTEGLWAIPWAHSNWDERAEPAAVGASAVFLAVQTAETFTGRFVHRLQFGKTWGTLLASPRDVQASSHGMEGPLPAQPSSGSLAGK